jgi:hypothetical protein
MPDGRGGYQKPSNPAPVSGPGAMSQRTDGGPGDPQPQRWVPTSDYGGATEMAAIQGQAPMAGSTKPIPLDAPTQHPDEPITAGAPFGPGPGPREMPQVAPEQAVPEDAAAAVIRAAYAAYPSPQLGALMDYLESQGR